MNKSLNRIWSICNTVTADIIYSSSQYNQAKNIYDFYKRTHPELPFSLVRYDLSRSYWQELNRVVEGDIHRALAAAVKFCKRTQPDPTTNNTNN